MKRLQAIVFWISLSAFNAVTDDSFNWQPAIQLSNWESRISWQDALSLLQSGVVDRVSQSHSLQVQLTLKNGNRYDTEEPTIDAIFYSITACGEPCRRILKITE